VAKPVIHISEMEAAKNFADLMAKVRAGNEVVIEHGAQPVAIVSPVELRPRMLSEAMDHGILPLAQRNVSERIPVL